MDYAIELSGRVFTPTGAAEITDIDAHNAQLEAAELAHWATAPERWQVYIDDTGMATTWRGVRLNSGTVEKVRFRTNISRNMVAVRFRATSGAEYYGRYGADSSQLCRVRKIRGSK